MRFEKLRIKSMGVFQGVHEWDFTSLPGKITAVIGPNGSGKTTALELLLGGLYRSCPTRGSLASLATARDSMVEVTVQNGQRYTVRQLVDCISGKGETVILNGDGNPVIESTKVRDADAWLAKHMPTMDEVLISIFASQQSAGFLGLKPAERKSVLLKILGIERYELLAAHAREWVRSTQISMATILARIQDERARGGSIADLSIDLGAAKYAADHIDADIGMYRMAMAQAEAESRDTAELLRAWQRRRAEAAELTRRAQEMQAKANEIEKRIANNRAVMARAGDIEKAKEQDAALQADLQTARDSQVRHEADLRVLMEKQQAALAELNKLQRDRDDAQRRLQDATKRLADADKIREAAGQIDGFTQAVNTARTAFEDADSELEQRRGLRIAGADGRIVGLRSGLTRIANGEPGPESLAVGTLQLDDDEVRFAAELPVKIQEALLAKTRCESDLDSARYQLKVAETLAARAGEMEAAEKTRSEELEAIESIKSKTYDADFALDATGSELGDKRKALIASQDALQNVVMERGALAPTLKLSEPLAQAQARLEELEPQHATAMESAINLRTQAKTVAPEGDAPTAPNLAVAQKRVADAEKTSREAHAAVAVSEKRLQDAEASAAKLANLEQQQRGIEGELADWTRLAADLGKDGLQGMLIDAAIPEIVTTSNTLMHAAFGPRFTVDLRTQCSDAKGKRLLETLDVIVIDTERGREAEAETLSGGEKVIISEALSLALTALACRQQGIDKPTICRDESGAALDSEKAPQYIQMLRKAGEMIGADKILFVAHNPEMWDLADARIEVGA